MDIKSQVNHPSSCVQSKMKCTHILTFFQGHEKEALNLMAAYLPKDNSPGSAFAEGGGLYALGEYWSLSCKVYHIYLVVRWEF